jgi:hypothetical protein
LRTSLLLLLLLPFPPNSPVTAAAIAFVYIIAHVAVAIASVPVSLASVAAAIASLSAIIVGVE